VRTLEMMTKTLLTVLAFILALSYVDATATTNTTGKSQMVREN